jgi:hypothetical protein
MFLLWGSSLLNLAARDGLEQLTESTWMSLMPPPAKATEK